MDALNRFTCDELVRFVHSVYHFTSKETVQSLHPVRIVQIR
jgi:hypothetical protein